MNKSTATVDATDLHPLHEASGANYRAVAALMCMSLGKTWNALNGLTKVTPEQHARLSAFYLEKITSKIAQVCQALGR